MPTGGVRRLCCRIVVDQQVFKLSEIPQSMSPWAWCQFFVFLCSHCVQMISADGEYIHPVSLVLPLEEVPVIDNQRVRSFYTWSGQASGWIDSAIFRDIIAKV